jgi:hypothetical protein
VHHRKNLESKHWLGVAQVNQKEEVEAGLLEEVEVGLLGEEEVMHSSSWQALDYLETNQKHLHHWDSKKGQ